MRILRLAGGGAVVAALILTAGCGSSHGSGSSTPSSPASTGSARGFAAYTACLRQHGVNVPTGPPSPGPSGRGRFGDMANQPAFKAARQACQSLQPRGRGNGQGMQALQAFRTCLGSHGVILPTPTPGAQMGRRGMLGALNQKDPKVAAALKICRPLLPNRTPGAAPTSSASPS